MRRTISVFSMMALGLMASASVQDAMTFRLALKASNVDKYVVKVKGVQNVEVPSMGAMDMVYDMGYNYAVKVVKLNEDGKHDVEFKTTDMTMKMTGALADMMGGQAPATPKEIVQTGKMDNRYRITDMKMGAMSAEMMMGMGASASMGFFVELPEGAVKAGDGITMTIPPTPMLGNKEALKLNGKFMGEITQDGVSGYKLEIAGTIPMNLDMGAMMEQMRKENPNMPDGGGMMDGMKMLIKGQIDIKQVAIIEKGTSKLLWSNVKMTSKANTELPDMGMSIPTNGTTEITAKFVP